MLVLTPEMMFLGEASFQGREGEGVGSETVATHQVKFFWLKLKSKTLFRATFSQPSTSRKTKEEEINAETFATMSLGAHVRGKGKLEGRLSDKKKRKTKARNLYEHLDPKRHGHV